MNHCVPDFDIHMDDEDYQIPAMPSANKKPSSSIGDEEIMELLWQNGQVVMQSQNHRPLRKPPPPARNSDHGPSTAREIRPELENYNNQHLFMQEDEMTSWLHYQINDQDPPLDQTFCADLLYAPPTVNANNHNSAMQTLARTSQLTELLNPPRTVLAPRPPIPPPRRPEQAARANVPYFACFSKHNARTEPGPSSSSKNVAKENTVVDSCDTPFATATAAAASRFSETARSSANPTEWDGGRGSMSSAGVAAPSTTSAGGGRGTMTYGMTMTSSPGGSSGSGELGRRVTAEDRKRKGREEEEWELQSEVGTDMRQINSSIAIVLFLSDFLLGSSVYKDVDFESADAKKQVGGSSTKRSRAAEVHNLSERRRRDRINEKMRALQELIPRCNKSDKASMLDEAIEYLKSLQLQVQMMSMGCSMVPMMFAGMQQYMPAMGMGMGMGMGMNRPVMPFPNMLAGSALPAATAAAHSLGPRFPMPPFHMPLVPTPDSSRMQAANQSDNNMLASVGTPDPNQPRIPNFTDPYQQYLGPHQMQFQLMQNQAMNQLNVSKPSTSKAPENPENHQSGVSAIADGQYGKL